MQIVGIGASHVLFITVTALLSGAVPAPERKTERVSHSVMPDSLWPHGPQPARLLCPWDFPGKNTGLGCHSLLRGIFPTQGSNQGLLHYMQILYCLSHQGRLALSRQKIHIKWANEWKINAKDYSEVDISSRLTFLGFILDEDGPSSPFLLSSSPPCLLWYKIVTKPW